MAAVSKVSLCNQALAKVGASRITNLTDNVEQARRCNEVFDDLLEQDLVYTHWNFAIDRATLQQLSQTPAHQFAYMYQLPSDYLEVVREINESTYKVEGDKLLSNAGTIQIVYLHRVTDMSKLSAAFRKAFIFRLASALAVPLAGSTSLMDEYDKKAEYYIKRAAAKDAQEDSPEERAEGSWTRDR